MSFNLTHHLGVERECNILGWFVLIVFFDLSGLRWKRLQESQVRRKAKGGKLMLDKIFCPDLFLFLLLSYQSIWGNSLNLGWIIVVISHTVCVKVNKNFAINLVAEEPVTDVESRVVSCDGGGGALGHPKVYINLVKPAVWINGLKWCVWICVWTCVFYQLCQRRLPDTS